MYEEEMEKKREQVGITIFWGGLWPGWVEKNLNTQVKIILI